MNSVDRDVVQAWQFLYEHPRLRWLPPLWRDRIEPSTERVAREVSAVERNLVVSLQPVTDNGTRFVVLIGPLVDLYREGEIDPLTPAMEIDQRLRGEGVTFEEAVCELASRVASVYGDS